MTNAAPIVITTSTPLPGMTKDTVIIEDVDGNTAANGIWTITRLSATTFELNDSAGDGAHISALGYPL